MPDPKSDQSGGVAWSGDPGGFNRPSFGQSMVPRGIGADIMGEGHGEPLGADPLPLEEIEGEVTRRLVEEKGLEAAHIKVEVRERVVVLRGRVASVDQREVAASLARGVPGVREVRDELRVA